VIGEVRTPNSVWSPAYWQFPFLGPTGSGKTRMVEAAQKLFSATLELNLLQHRILKSLTSTLFVFSVPDRPANTCCEPAPT
jgi:hypothetical protein